MGWDNLVGGRWGGSKKSFEGRGSHGDNSTKKATTALDLIVVAGGAI